MKSSKKGIIFLLVFICVVLAMFSVALWGRTNSNGLMADASPSNGALTLYYYNGEKVYYSQIFSSDTIQSVLDELDSVKTSEAKKWSLDDITLPIYGLDIVAADGSGIFVAWSNNYWISQDGTVYNFKFNFEKLETEYLLMNEYGHSFSVFPCARFLTQDKNGWNTELLTPAENLDSSNDVTITLNSWNNDIVSVNIKNNRNTAWTYGEYYSLQVLMDNVWYEIPTVPGHWVFYAIAYTLPSGAEREKTYNLTMYGELPVGIYRLVVEGFAVENTIP